MEINGNYVSENFNFDSSQIDYSTAVSTLTEDKLSPRYYKRKQN